jgi:hypothetical protein
MTLIVNLQKEIPTKNLTSHFCSFKMKLSSGVSQPRICNIRGWPKPRTHKAHGADAP